MAAVKLWLGLCLLASWYSVIASQDCPSGWKNYNSSCYLFVIPNVRIRQMSWEDSRANCRGYGADLVSILDTSEVDFIYKQTSVLGNYRFWIGLFRNKTTNDPKEGWVWSDKNNFTNPQQWKPGEPNNYQNNEDCAELFAMDKKWNDNDCSKSFSSICKRRKGLPFPPTPTYGTLPPTKDPPPRCGHGWIAYNRSCYRMFQNWKPWAAAKSSCRDTGGHLVRIDNDDEQHFLSNLVRPKRFTFWIGLNDLAAPGNWTWEFRPNDPLKYRHWQSGEPNGLGVEQCAEMYGYAQAGLWNDANCRGFKSYICEKEEGRNACPEGWIAYNDTCYQFNLDASQKMTWSNAEAACNAIGNFASLAKINSQSEQDFINKRIQSITNGGVWIGLNDIKKENVFRWSADNSQLVKSKSYQIWINGKYPSENQENRDCVMMQSVRKDGAWTVQNCSQTHYFVCTRHRDLPFCNAPLGMENGKISDSQITASSSLPPTRPSDARFRHSGSWCPQKAAKTEYLQIVLPFLADIRTIVTQGNVTSYTVKVSKDGRKFKDYNPSSRVKHLQPRRGENYDYFDTTSLAAEVIRIYPYSWRHYPCLRVEFVGCPAQAPKTDGCEGNNWQKGPGKLCYQINSVPKTWIDARSTCLDRGGDLLAMATTAEMNEIAAKIRTKSYTYYWIGLNDRDYRNSYYWSNTDANGMINWGSGAPDDTGYTNIKGCVRMKRGGTTWTDTDCSNRYPFICMKGEHYTPTNFVGVGPTGVWMSSAKYYWPLSRIIDKKLVLGTILGNVTGKVTATTGVRGKSNSSLKFSGEGSYIDVGKFENECFGNPDICAGLSLSFMAWFDTTTISSSQIVYIMGSMKDKTKSNGLNVYVQDNKMTFVVSGTRKYWSSRISVTDNQWLHYVMTFDRSSGVDVFVNGGRVTGNRGEGVSSNTNPTSSFKIGYLSGSNLKSGEVRLTMVAFWDRKISDYDISSIYKAEFGTCPFSWFEYGMSCYQINNDRKSHYSATNKCQSFGGDLINIDTNVEQAFISSKLTDKAWIGAQDKGREGVFVRTDLKPIQYSNWNGGEPNNHWRGEDCAETYKSGLWNDVSCYILLPYICEKEKEVNVKPTNITTTATPTVSSITKSVTVCHYTRNTIGCPSGLVIKINSAFWGRREKPTCTYISVKPCGVKGIPTITKNLKRKCDHYDSCILHASESESYLDNPCPTVHKYLEVNYTCTKDTLQKKCKPEWTTFNGNAGRCYRLFHTPKTWNEARRICRNAGGELLSIPGDLMQRFATSLMERAWYSNVWIGLNDLNTSGVYEWSDGSSVTWTNWYVGQPDERKTDKSCVYMSLRRGKKGWMYWSDQNCIRKYAFMCRYDVESTTQKPTTVSPAKNGKCKGAGWVTNDKLPYCYLHETSTSGKNWLNAQNTCRARSGKLVSIDSTEENEFVRKLSNNSIWLGLEARGVFRGHQWSDGQPVRFTNWDYGQPNSYNGLDACVSINPDTGFWNDRDCNEVKDVVCKMAKNFVPVTTAPVTYPTPGSSLCKKGWTLYQGMCYVVGNQTSSDYLTWQDAEKKCQSFGNGGHLVSIHSDDEQKFINFLMPSIYTSYFWTGLNDLGTEASYQWTDGSYYNYANWNTRQPDDWHRQENCIHIIRSNGKWNDNHCQFKYSFICKAYNESYKPPVRPTKVPRPANDGYCPKGWIAHAQYCYEFHTDPSEYRSWDDARDSCERGRNSSANGELVSIHDEFEEAFITSRIKGATNTLWTGMNNRRGYNRYFWVDNSIANYFKWNTREPVWGWGRCVEIVPYRWAAGRWNSVSCSKLNGYICKKASSKTPVTPTPTPQESNCKSGYKSYDKSCFKFNNDNKKSFDGARKICQQDGGDLMVVDNQFKQAYLIYLLERYIGSVWIGYHHEPYSTFKFVDQSSAVHTYWGSGQPSRQLSQRSCTQVNATGSNFGVWDDVDCGTTNPFICEIYQGEPRITIPLNGTCADGWKYYNKHCYKHFTSWRKWGQAQFICSTNGANLVSIHDDREQDFLIYFYQHQHPFKIWTGLNDRARERGYSWVDNSPVNYINWQDGEPNDHTGHENCIEMETRSGQWNDLPCTLYRQFMCKKNIECSSAIPLDLSLVTVTDTYNSTTMGADKAIITDLKDHNSAWCTKNTSGIAKIMIDLNQLVRITGITVMGRGLNYVKSFRIDYERDENWRTFYPNRDYQSAIQQHTALASTKTFRYPITADGLSITPLTWTGDIICMSIRLHGCAYVCQKQLYLSFPARIRDDVITASSSKYPAHGPKQTAIEGHTWCAGKNDKDQWIQFNFGEESLISVVRTFGDKKESYVTKYFMQFSEDGLTWTDYVQHGVKRIFNGNSDPNSPMRHTLANPIEASYVRIVPIAWNKNICMRISLLGCEADCKKPLLASGKAPSLRYSSTDKNSNPEYALFNSGKAWCTGKSPVTEQYLEIRFRTQYRLSKIATLPGPVGYEKGGEITAFTIKFNKGKNWFVQGPKGQAKMFVAINEDDKSKPMVNELTDYYRKRAGLRTRAIRIYPKTFTGSPSCLRVELYGCLSGIEVVPTTPSSEQKVVKASVRFTGIEWNNKLSDETSQEFAETSKKITNAVESVYSKSESFRSAKVIKLTKGSVIAIIKLVFNREFADKDNETTLANAVATGKVGKLEVDKDSFKVVGPDTEASSKGDSDSGLSGGAVAGVVITVLIILAVAGVLAFFLYRRKKRNSLFAPKHFDNPISYSSKAYDMDD